MPATSLALRFRAYEPTDCAACLALFDANCPAFFAPNERADYLTFLSTAAGSYELCLVGQQVVGAFGLAPHPAGGLALRWILVSPHVHGRGIGSLIMTRVLDTLRVGQVSRLHIGASHKSAPFFAKFGAQEVATTLHGWGPEMHRADMLLDVSGVPTAPPVQPAGVNAETGDLSPEVFRTYGYQIVDRITRYLAEVEDAPVLARVAPGEVTAALPAVPPATPESLDRILADFEHVILPATTHWNHPAFFAYFAKSTSAPGILGEMLIAALDVNAMLWKAAPAATELEVLVLDWLRQLLGLRPGWFGVLNDTASISSMLALAAAREAAGLDVRQRGTAGRTDLPTLRIYCSEQTHSSVDKAALTLGFGQDNLVHLPTDDAFRMRPELLARAIQEDKARGMRPIAVVATIGTTAVTSIDPVPAIAEICRREGVWLHVDAAYGGAVGVVPEMRHYLAGVDEADSLVVNPHKWLLTPSDCSAFWVKDQALLKRTFALVPEYLVTAEQDDVVNLMDYGVQLGRRFRALKLWMVLRAFGAEGLASRVRAHCALASEFGSWVDDEPGWERMAPTHFSLVCFRYAPDGMDAAAANRLNEEILACVNASGEAFLSHTRLNGRYTLRLAIGNLRTERRHVARAWELLRAAARQR